MKSQKLLDSFIAYCKAHPEMRFWQALRNWCGWSFLCVTNDQSVLWTNHGIQDTFSWEANQKP